MDPQNVKEKENPRRYRILTSTEGKFKEIKNTLSKKIIQIKAWNNDDSVEQKNSSYFKSQLQRVRELYERQREVSWQKSKEAEGLQNQLRVLKIQIQSIYSQNSKIKQELKLAHSKISGLQKQKVEWMQQFYKLNNSINFNKAKVEAIEKNESNIKRENQGLRKKINQEKQQNIQIYKNIESLQSKIHNKNKQIQNLRDNNKNKQIQIKKLKQQNAFQEKQKIRRIKTEESFHEEKSFEMKNLIQPLELHNQNLQDKVQELLKQLEGKQEQLERQRCHQENILHSSEANSFRFKLILKEKYIEKLSNQVKSLEEKVEILKIEKRVLETKKYQGSVFTPKAYNKFSLFENQVHKIKLLQKQNRQLSFNLESKQSELQKSITQKQKVLEKIQSSTIVERKISADLKKKAIEFERNQMDMTSKIKQLTRQVQKLRKSDISLKKQIAEKDRIILKYIGK